MHCALPLSHLCSTIRKQKPNHAPSSFACTPRTQPYNQPQGLCVPAMPIRTEISEPQGIRAAHMPASVGTGGVPIGKKKPSAPAMKYFPAGSFSSSMFAQAAVAPKGLPKLRTCDSRTHMHTSGHGQEGFMQHHQAPPFHWKVSSRHLASSPHALPASLLTRPALIMEAVEVGKGMALHA